jgi:2-polyprenyl-3-methyl-5-hydroxy-6-metoxy-1,4-benzoquinol methylase
MLGNVLVEGLYEKIYGDDPVPDAEKIEPESVALDAERQYARYAWAVQEAKDLEAETYIDLACYLGSLPLTIANKVPSIKKAYGVDMTKQSINIARSRAEKFNLEDKTEFFVDNVEGFNKVKADLVTAFEVIEHVKDPVKFVKNLADIANKWVLISTPNGCYDDGRGNMGHWEWDGNEMHTRGHVRAFRKGNLKKLIEDCGCVIDIIEERPNNVLWVKFRKDV